MSTAKEYQAATRRNMRAWVNRCIARRDPADAARCLRAFDALPDNSPSLDGVDPTLRAALRADLAKAAGARN